LIDVAPDWNVGRTAPLFSRENTPSNFYHVHRGQQRLGYIRIADFLEFDCVSDRMAIVIKTTPKPNIKQRVCEPFGAITTTGNKLLKALSKPSATIAAMVRFLENRRT
jgi:hypothetical protein